MIRWRFSTLHTRTWLDIVRVVVSITLRLQVFGTTDGEILLEQCNVSRVASKDCDDHVPEDGNHSTTAGYHLICEHLCCKPIREPRYHKEFQRVARLVSESW